VVSFYPSQIIEYLYCPRYTFFEYVLRIPQYEDKYYKVMRGREIHDLRLVQNKDYLRKKIGVVNKWLDQYLSIKGLRGIVDEVLQLNDGTFAPLDYKFAEWEDVLYETYRQQLFCYATLIEVNFKAQVNKGFLIYTRSKNKLIEVGITEQNKQSIKKSIEEMREIIAHNNFPKGTKNKKKCINCTYRNICIK
jgi:CRISPR-associated exonuclease Cas4